MHTTNYTNTFIQVADDCKAHEGKEPPEKQPKTTAQIQFEMIRGNPYVYTSDDVIFAAYAEKAGIAPEAREAARAEFFSKGQACLRASPLGKTYGWGIHADAESKVAVFAVDSDEYAEKRANPEIKQLKAMKSTK